MQGLEGPGRSLQFIEQYDPEDTSENAITQPYAFVTDRVVIFAGGAKANELQSAVASTLPPLPSRKARAPTAPLNKAQPFNSPAKPTDLSVNVEELIAEGPGFTPQAWEALADLRDKIADAEKIGWWIVYNGDPERIYDTADEDEDDDEDEGEDEDEDEEVETEESVSERQLSQGRVSVQSHPEEKSPSYLSSRTKNSSQISTPRSPISPASGTNTLPIREGSRRPPPLAASEVLREGKEREREQIPEPPKAKELAKSQGMRRKFFGKRV